MWSIRSLVDPTGFDLSLGILDDVNCVTFKHSSRSRPLNDSMCTFSVGFPTRKEIRAGSTW